MAAESNPPKGASFGKDPKDFDTLRVDNNDLLWDGKKVKTGGWSVAEKLTAAGIVVAGTLTIFGNLDKMKPNACLVYDFTYCKQYKPAQPAAGQKTGGSPELQKSPDTPVK
jgi:hypothetical protein